MVQRFESLGILASQAARTHGFRPEESLPDFIRIYQDVLSKYHLRVTEGTFDDVFRSEQATRGQGEWSCRYDQMVGTVLRPGKDGGLIQLSTSVLNGSTKVVIFQMDPQDTEENFPENRQLIRICAMHDAIPLLNFHSASLWAANENPWGPGGIPSATGDDTVALIAHDEKKIDMCHFVTKYRDQLATFQRIIATGTTAGRVKQFLDLFGDVGDRIVPMLSGPLGGDAAIAEEIIEGRCQHVCFFVDPTAAHAHEADIWALIRACTFEGVKVNLRLTYAAAESWIRTVQQPSDSSSDTHRQPVSLGSR